MDKGEEKLISDIKEFGWHVLLIADSVDTPDEERKPSFAYSVGLYQTFKHPEIIVFGLDLELMHHMINGIGDEIKNGHYFRDGQAYANILEGFDCHFIEIAKSQYSEYLLYAMWLYEGDDFPVLQCVWPTTSGQFPWDKGYPEDLVEWQPLLNSPLRSD